jgi:hypothetical protein
MIYEEDQVDRLWIKQRFPNLFVVPGTLWVLSGTLVAVPERDGQDLQRHSERAWTARQCDESGGLSPFAGFDLCAR